ncbi:MAG TPA: hypothetical protein VN282_20580 [Pyrinomonadaceae bacterium]|nr:hypothetical protein [Pyrinomonadaceae bacterium]
MKAGQTLRALGLALALSTAAYAQTQQPDPPPRRPQGPAAGPIIKLPPGSGAVEEQAKTPGAKEQAATATAQPQRWEYCLINAVRVRQKSFGIGSSVQVVAAYVRYLPEGSEEIEGASEEEALGNALAKLGEDGWELTAVRTDLHLLEGSGRTTSVYFFKRPKRQE